jgi:hypothetical protein
MGRVSRAGLAAQMKWFYELANGQQPECMFMIKGLDARFAAKAAE